MIYIREKGAEPDVIDRRRGPARQLAGHARSGARCYRLYYYTYLSVVVLIVRESTADDGRRTTTTTTTRRGAGTFRSAGDEKELKNTGTKTEEDVHGIQSVRRNKRQTHAHTNSGQNITHTQP